MRKLVWLVPAAAALLLAACGGGGEGEETPTSETGGIVTYDTEDGAHIVAQFALPRGLERPPVVILLHQYQGSHEQWQPLISPLLDRGYAVLAPDLRSFGESTRCSRGGQEERCRLDNLDDLEKDVFAALSWLGARNDIDYGRIAVIGASIGANLAYVSSGEISEARFGTTVKTAIAMSPNANPRGGTLLGGGPAFSPHSILFMSDEAESGDARTLSADVAGPVDVKVYSGNTAHGVQLLENPQAVQDILDWLARTL